MKSYTDLDQSKRLAEILPLESADMCYKCIGEDPYDVCLRPYSEWREEYKGLLVAKEVDVIPCWSLAALFKMLPYSARLERGSSTELCSVTLPNELESSDWYIEPVDAAFETILKLHKLKML